jgi:hypothetical protein
MTVPVSTVPAVLAVLKVDIIDQVQPGPSGDAVLVCFGEPAQYSPNDIIQINVNVRRTVKPQVFMGSYDTFSLQEDYQIEVLCSSWSGSTDVLAPMNRAYELNSYVETAVRSDPTFGGLVDDAHPAGTSGGAPTPTENPIGWMSELTSTIAVTVLN